MKNTEIPRLLLCQAEHDRRWPSATAGNWAIVTPKFGNEDGEFKDAGRVLTACILAYRDTAMRVKEWYSLKPAAEKHHDRTTSDYRAIARKAQDTSSYFLEGVEALLHTEEHGLVTYFAGRKATSYLRKAIATSNARTNHKLYPNLYPVFRMKPQKTTNWQSGFQFTDLKWQLVSSEAQETIKSFTSAHKTFQREPDAMVATRIDDAVADIKIRARDHLKDIYRRSKNGVVASDARQRMIEAVRQTDFGTSLWPPDLEDMVKAAEDRLHF